MSIALSGGGNGECLSGMPCRLFWLRHFICFVVAFAVAFHFWEIAFYGFRVYQSGPSPFAIICMPAVNAAVLWLPQVAIIFWIKPLRFVRPETAATIGASTYVTLSSICHAVMQRWIPEPPGSNGNLFLAWIELTLFTVVVTASVFMVIPVCRLSKAFAA